VLEHHDQRLGEDRLVEIEDVLDNVVSERILNQNISIVRDLSNEPSLLITRSVVNATLQDTATMTVGSDINAVGANSIKDELSINGGQLVEALLDDVVAVQILDELDNSVAKSIDDGLNLTRGGDELDHLLQSSGAVLVESDTDEIMRGILDQDSTLLIIAILEQLLAEVVSEGIGHQLDDMLIGLKPDHMNLLRVTVLELLLQVAASMLILAESIDLTTELLKLHVGEPVHGYRSVSKDRSVQSSKLTFSIILTTLLDNTSLTVTKRRWCLRVHATIVCVRVVLRIDRLSELHILHTHRQHVDVIAVVIARNWVWLLCGRRCDR